MKTSRHNHMTWDISMEEGNYLWPGVNWSKDRGSSGLPMDGTLINKRYIYHDVPRLLFRDMDGADE